MKINIKEHKENWVFGLAKAISVSINVEGNAYIKTTTRLIPINMDELPF